MSTRENIRLIARTPSRQLLDNLILVTNSKRLSNVIKRLNIT